MPCKAMVYTYTPSSISDFYALTLTMIITWLVQILAVQHITDQSYMYTNNIKPKSSGKVSSNCLYSCLLSNGRLAELYTSRVSEQNLGIYTYM